MSILVTGGAGYVGSHTVKELKKKGHEVVVYDNLSRGHRWALRGDAFVEGDLADENTLRAVFRDHKITAVLHFAAFAYVGESVAEPGKYYQNNVANSLTLLGVMIEQGVRQFILSSTCAVYGDPKKIPLEENHPRDPVNPYGMTKLVVERMLADYEQAEGLRSMCLRYFNAAGADPEGDLGEDHDPETHLIPRILRTALTGTGHVEIYGTDYSTQDGTCVRDYVHVTDLGDAHVRALEWLADGGRSEAINLGIGKGYSVNEVIEASRRVTKAAIPTSVAARRAGDPPVLLAGAGKAKSLLHWTPKFQELEAIIATAWNWHRSRP